MNKLTSRFVMVVVIMIVIGLAVFAARLAMAPAPTTPQPLPEITTTYIHPVDWPPQVQILNKLFSCAEPRIISNHTYCISTSSEGAAGSTYTNYTYAIASGQNTMTFTFTLKAVQCDNYDDPQKTACKTERAAFNIDPIIDQIAQNLTVNI